MGYVIISVDKTHASKINTILKDDLISRQSIVIRDASAMNIEKDVRYVLIEGSEESLKKAEELFKEIGKIESGEDAKSIYSKIMGEETDVASGVGMLFGD
jgi:hypothetical protein